MAHPRAEPASPLPREKWEEKMCDDLLAGLSVPRDIRARALDIVRADSEARRQLITDRQAHLEEQDAMMLRRDAAIRALLDEAAHPQFDANSAKAAAMRTA